MGLFSRLKDGLTRTRDALVERVTVLVRARAIDEALLVELEETLLAADIGVATAGVLMERMRARVRREGLREGEQLTAILKEELRALLVGTDGVRATATKPRVILIVGVNGVGKTTTIGKLANQFKREGLRVMIGAADTFRAAANDQLDVWAGRAGVEVVGGSGRAGGDPGAVAFETVQRAVRHGTDVVIIDTAGRLHTKAHLMAELEKVHRVIRKVLPDAPHEVLLILDATTGQNAIAQARQFDASVGVTGLVITKLDGTAKGGVVFAIANELKLPVRYVGVGEGIDDLQPFDPEQFVDALFATA